AAAGERSRDEGLPDRARRVVADPSVEHGPAVAVIDQVEIDVIEPKRQRHAHPQNPGGDLDDFPRFGCRWERVVEGVGSFCVHGAPYSASWYVAANLGAAAMPYGNCRISAPPVDPQPTFLSSQTSF